MTARCLLEERRNGVVAAIARHVDECIAVEIGLVRLCPGIEQPPHVFDAPIAHGLSEFNHER